ncbi:2'-5' RNA ligase [Actinoplanes lutulentus]|uniref:2'-5' RNA ligase superfamily protein n=1 Tax=Actinoplanes lutulentus TaxID=1287878 RepID=A0A327Z1K0_9ACTN|nr:2'-5' RNA ligase family protein [Actinoplanes lutulentus]MBB2947578.1 2'-5' RNA ligase [Actinoplanes lutulentus]RAK27634.1 2'-5' RNA ligase superfamily protein [Actinoplanes lutulentus]
MLYAIELFLDERADADVRRMWAALDERGVRSLGGIPGADHHPHVTLSVFSGGDLVRIADVLRPVLAEAVGLPLTLGSLGFFLTGEAPAFLGVVPSSRLLEVHRRVHSALEPLVDGIWPYYRPDALVPHCTLAVGVTDKAQVIEVVSAFPMPVQATVAAVYLVELPGGQARTCLTQPAAGLP